MQSRRLQGVLNHELKIVWLSVAWWWWWCAEIVMLLVIEMFDCYATLATTTIDWKISL